MDSFIFYLVRKMDSRIREALVDLTLAVLKGLKILVVYILPSALVALLLSSELRDYLATKPELVGIVPVINVVLVTVADLVKKQLPADNTLKKIL